MTSDYRQDRVNNQSSFCNNNYKNTKSCLSVIVYIINFNIKNKTDQKKIGSMKVSGKKTMAFYRSLKTDLIMDAQVEHSLEDSSCTILCLYIYIVVGTDKAAVKRDMEHHVGRNLEYCKRLFFRLIII